MRNLNNSCKLFGIYLLKNNQQCDNTLETVHFKERCKTEEIFYGVLSGESKGIYKSLNCGIGSRDKKTGKLKYYTVTRNVLENTFECSCPATDYRPWLKECKHIRRLKEKL